MPVTPAMRPLNSISSAAENPISAPPIAAEIGVKLAYACLVVDAKTAEKSCTEEYVAIPSAAMKRCWRARMRSTPPRVHRTERAATSALVRRLFQA